MSGDPIIDTIRKVRHEISAEVGHDPYKLVEFFQRRQKEREAKLKTKRPDAPAKKDETAA